MKERRKERNDMKLETEKTKEKEKVRLLSKEFCL